MITDQKLLAMIMGIFKTTITNVFFMSPFTYQFW